MNKEIHQKISQFLDDDLHPKELDDLLLKMRQQPNLKDKISRYHTASHALKADDFLMTKESFLEGISQQIQQQPIHLVSSQKMKKKQWLGWQSKSVALAASVALVSVLMIQQDQAPSQPNTQTLVQKQVPELETPIKTAKVSELSQHERFKAYLQAHSDDLYIHGSLNYQPAARVAKFTR